MPISATSRSYAVCRFIQLWASVPKKRARRRAVSAVIERLPAQISSMRRCGGEAVAGDLHRFQKVFQKDFAGVDRRQVAFAHDVLLSTSKASACLN